jgi:hypothetical protein
MKSEKIRVDSTMTKSRILYLIGIAATLIVSLAHIAYTFVEYEKLDEQALWFFCGGLAVIFNSGLNITCLLECTKLNYAITMVANIALLIFGIMTVFVIAEAQTLCFAAVAAYTTAISYVYYRNVFE